MNIQYANIFHRKTLQNLPKLGFLFENKPSGDPGAELLFSVNCPSTTRRQQSPFNHPLQDARLYASLGGGGARPPPDGAAVVVGFGHFFSGRNPIRLSPIVFLLFAPAAAVSQSSLNSHKESNIFFSSCSTHCYSIVKLFFSFSPELALGCAEIFDGLNEAPAMPGVGSIRLLSLVKSDLQG
jgi:hypothetical protein